ncbi:hypothetical protein F4805DRAFT_471868 [Annulohypoxylon moriforme]|nr:hypothetical protein F4805DRAFT_471868 [Annulohypoxylon moriforme]
MATHGMHNAETLMKRYVYPFCPTIQRIAILMLRRRKPRGYNGTAGRHCHDSGTERSPQPDETQPIAIVEFDNFIETTVGRYVNLSNRLGDPVAAQARCVLNGFHEQRKFLEKAAKTQKPNAAGLQTLIQPTMKAIADVIEIKEANRTDRAYNHLTCVADGILVLNWVSVEIRPFRHVDEMLGCAKYFGNKILVEFKSSQSLHLEWVQAFYQIFHDLSDLIKQHFSLGIRWGGHNAGPYVNHIRCDRESPCSNCQASGLACQVTNVNAGHQNKNKNHDPIEGRITKLEAQLLNLERRLSDKVLASDGQNDEPRSNPRSVDHPYHEPIPKEEVVLYEGLSSFKNQSEQTINIIRAITHLQGAEHLNELFDILESSLQSTSSQTVSNERRVSSTPISSPNRGMVDLPVEIVTTVINHIKREPPVLFYSWILDDISLLEKLCQNIYFPTEPLSNGGLTSTYGILRCVFKELRLRQSHLCEQFDLRAYETTCEQNFSIGLQTQQIFTEPSFENILALTLAIMNAYEEGKSRTCSTLLSTAINHCQLLGLHRESTYNRNRNPQSKYSRRLFWALYILDKNMSLVSGRAPKIYDFDIDVEHPQVTPNPGARAWDESFLAFIKLAQLQSHIYCQLYSVQALAKPPPFKAQQIEALSSSLQQWKASLNMIDSSNVDHFEIFELSRRHWDLIYLSTFTLLLGAAPKAGAASEINPQCSNSAREYLECNLECFQKYQKHGMVSGELYANAFLLLTSFTPFLVTFLHAVTTINMEDIFLLDKTVRLLENLRQSSPEIMRLHRVCEALSNLASAIINREICAGETPEEQQVSLPFDSQLISDENLLQDIFSTNFASPAAGAALADTSLTYNFD